MMSDSGRGAIYGISAAAIWGGMYVVSDVVLDVIPPFALLSLRLVLGLVSLSLIHLFYQPGDLHSRAARWQMISVGIVGFGISLGAQFVGTHLSNAVNGALVTSASPAFIVFFATLLLKEKLSRARLFSIVIASVGVILIIDPRKAQFGSDTFAGDLALAIAALTWGLYSVLVRRVSTQADTLTFTRYAFAGGLLITMPAAFIEAQSHTFGTINLPIILGVLYLGIISTAVAMWLWNRAFALAEASRVSLYFFAQPLVGAGLGILLLEQHPTALVWLGGGLILAGVFISARYG